MILPWKFDRNESKKSDVNTDRIDPDFDGKIWIVCMCVRTEGEGDIIAMITLLTVINVCVCRIRLAMDLRSLN
jgi:hypothetical protein